MMEDKFVILDFETTGCISTTHHPKKWDILNQRLGMTLLN